MTVKYLNEDMSLQRGIFWVKDTDDIYGTGLYFTVPCDSSGNNLIDPEAEYSSKDGISRLLNLFATAVLGILFSLFSFLSIHSLIEDLK